MTKNDVIKILVQNDLIYNVYIERYDINDFTVIREFSGAGTRIEKDMIGRGLFLSNKLIAFKTDDNVRVDIRYNDDKLSSCKVDRYNNTLLLYEYLPTIG